MIDPRVSIPDTVLTAPDGSLWLCRTAQLIVGASRNEAPRITLDGELLPVREVGPDGIAKTLPGVIAREGFHYDLDSVPPELAQDLAVWMAGQAETNGRKLLSRLYPTTPDTVPQEIAP